jgi:HK97 family phage major capsid protein
MSRRDDLNAEKLRHLKAARDLGGAAEAAGRDFTDEERTAVKAHLDAAKAANDRILVHDGDRAMLDQVNALGLPVGELAKSAGSPAGGHPGQTLGERFTKSDAFVNWLGQFPSGRIAEGAKGIQSPPIEFALSDVARGAGGAKALITGGSDTSGGSLVQNDWRGLIDGLGQFVRPLVVADLVTAGQTQSDTIEYARVTGFTNNASPVPEATSAATIGDGTGGTVTPVVGGRKPESGLALQKVSATVKTIAHWIPATKRALSDAGQVRTLIDEFLRYGLAEELEDQILTGNATGENFEGILNTPGVQAQAWDTDLLVTLRRARTLVRIGGRTVPTAFLLNPIDMEKVDLLRNTHGDFYFGGPTQAPNAQPSVWGLPRVEAEAMPPGVGLVGNFRQAVLWDREQAAIQVSDSHSDFFVRNLVAILAEMRAAFGVIRPLAFATIDLTP